MLSPPLAIPPRDCVTIKTVFWQKVLVYLADVCARDSDDVLLPLSECFVGKIIND
jgi:hypothetical protein